eukprot:TRINITY_DN7826_c0_g2_i14.p1 TRINITY_DN7826_c0_g2~~TRINITY_DN7826_c0_g2_i14.p1  ORF type:complete len:115 (-),score=5.85 TRINITY_DN7826_c0_g2_i14:407-751(-)
MYLTLPRTGNRFFRIINSGDESYSTENTEPSASAVLNCMKVRGPTYISAKNFIRQQYGVVPFANIRKNSLISKKTEFVPVDLPDCSLLERPKYSSTTANSSKGMPLASKSCEYQ